MDSTPRTRPYAPDIHDKIARVYYSHGLFCSSHPYSVIFVTLCIFMLCCYPLLYLPLLGSSSQEFITPVQGFVPPDIVLDGVEGYKFNGPRWFQGPPINELLRNHQIYQRTANHTSLGDLCLQVSEPLDELASDILPHYDCLIIFTKQHLEK
ncbi:hypothetical protein CEXT_302741 [Caerostris extrusa]|nr:hypothetical protein CEXT_302741 [Caerostris extrusa]